MATDWAADVRKYAKDADDGVIAGIVRYCGIALRNRDSSLVSFSDPKELARVRGNFLKRKLGLTDADATLDAAIAKVGDAMKADRTKNRVTVYYLLAQEFGKLDAFAPKAKAPAKKDAKPTKAPAAKLSGAVATKPVATKAAPAKTEKAPAKAAAAKKAAAPTKAEPIQTVALAAPLDKGATTADSAAVATSDSAPDTTSDATAKTAHAVGSTDKNPSAMSGALHPVTTSPANDDTVENGANWLWWVLLGLLALFLVWWFFLSA